MTGIRFFHCDWRLLNISTRPSSCDRFIQLLCGIATDARLFTFTQMRFAVTTEIAKDIRAFAFTWTRFGIATEIDKDIEIFTCRKI